MIDAVLQCFATSGAGGKAPPSTALGSTTCECMQKVGERAVDLRAEVGVGSRPCDFKFMGTMVRLRTQCPEDRFIHSLNPQSTLDVLFFAKPSQICWVQSS